MGNALIRMKTLDASKPIMAAEQVQAARLNRKLAESKAADAERFRAEGANLVAGDQGAMKRMAIIDPDKASKLITAFGQMDKNQREAADREIEQAGRMWQWVVSGADEAEQEARYQRVRAAMPNLNLPETYDPNIARQGIAAAVELKTMIDQQNYLARQDNQAGNAMMVDNNQAANALTLADRKAENEGNLIDRRGAVQGRLNAERDARGLQNDMVLEAIRSRDRRAIAKMEAEGRISVAKAKEAAKGAGGIKTSDANSIRSAVAMANSGMYDPQTGEFKFADPQSAARAVQVAAEAERIFMQAAASGSPIGPAEAVQQALGGARGAGGMAGAGGPAASYDANDPLGLR